MRLLRGNCQRTHGPYGYSFAYDFDLSIGDTVLAARSGVVVIATDSFPDGNRVTGQENEIVIRHADGIFSRYVHLMESGAFVAAGDSVTTGEAIGRSGDTGNSTGPHLHFDLARCPGHGCATVPVSFYNVQPRELRLRTGEWYTAAKAPPREGRSPR